MRHARGYRRLNRTHEHRKALWANMSGSLIEHEQIKTTLQRQREADSGQAEHEQRIASEAKKRPRQDEVGERIPPTNPPL